MDGIVSVPNFSGFFAGAYSPRVPSLTVFKNSVRDGPRYVDMTAGGASMAPRRKSLPGDAIARRIKSPCLSMAETMADMTSGKISGLPVTELTCFGFIKLRPSEVPMDQLLCLPEPLMPANGFSCRSPARPAYLRRGDGGAFRGFPRLRARAALVAAQMVSYHERFTCDAKTLSLFHVLITGGGLDDVANDTAFRLCPKYKRGVLREYVRAAAELGAEKKSAGDGERGDGDGDDSDAVEDAMDNALDAMLEAQMAGRIDEFDDDFDAIAAEEAASRRKKKKRRR